MPTPTPTQTPTPTPTPTVTRVPTLSWNMSSCPATKYFEIYRACVPDESTPPLSAYEVVDVVYNTNARSWVEPDLINCRICHYFVAAANPLISTLPLPGIFNINGTLADLSDDHCSVSHSTTIIAPLSTTVIVGPPCTPTPTPTEQCYPYDFELGDTGVTYKRCQSREKLGIKYIKCVNVLSESYPPRPIPEIIPPFPLRPYCHTPTPTPTDYNVEFDLCYPPTPTPTPTPTISPTPTVTPPPTPTPTLTPTPTPTCPYEGILVQDDSGGNTSNITFTEGRFNDNDRVTITYNNLNTGLSGNMYTAHLLTPTPGATYALPISATQEVEITITSIDSGRFPPATIDVSYNNIIEIDNIYLHTGEKYTFRVYRPV